MRYFVVRDLAVEISVLEISVLNKVKDRRFKHRFVYIYFRLFSVCENSPTQVSSIAGVQAVEHVRLSLLEVPCLISRRVVLIVRGASVRL